MRYNRTGADDASGSDRDTGQDERARAYESIFANRNLRCHQGNGGVGEVVTTGAQIGFLRNNSAGSNFNFAESVGVGAIAQASAIMQGQIPWNRDARALMD